MNSIAIRIDPKNPGHFFAACGLFDLSAEVNPDVEARFDLSHRTPRQGKFVLAGIEVGDLKKQIGALVSATYSAAVDEPELNAILPIRVDLGGRVVTLNWWLREFQDRAVALKGWGGQVTSLKLFRDLAKACEVPTDLGGIFEMGKPTSSRFGVDPRSAWNTIDLGYSPNEQGQEADSFPWAELLAAFGLQRFRPIVGRRRQVPYFLWSDPLHRIAAQTGAFCPWEGLGGWQMIFSIEGRGQSYKYFAYGRRVSQGELAELLRGGKKAKQIEEED